MKKLLFILLCLPMIGFGQCEHPDNITSELIDSTTVLIKWDYKPNISHYRIKFREFGSSTWSLTSNISGNDSLFVMNNLNANAIYEYTIKSWCVNGSVANWIESIFFNTFYMIWFNVSFCSV